MSAFLLSTEHDELRAAIRRFAEEQVAPHAAEVDERAEFPWKSYEAYRDSGFIRLPYPVEHGGDGGDGVAYAILVEEVARVCASSSLFVLISRLACAPVLRHASAELQAAVVPKVVAGEWQGSYCLSEPQAGSDVAAMTTRAVRDGDHYVLNGRKAWITNAGISDFYTVFAKTDPDTTRGGINAFVVEQDTPGLAIGKIESKMGMRASPTGELLLDDVSVPADHLIGDEGAAFRYAMQALDGSRPIVGAQAVGIAQGALEAAARYATERSQFGARVADFQGIQFMLAEMAMKVDAARLLVYRACALLDAGQPGTSKASAMAKWFASDTAMQVTTDAVQILGGVGYVRDFPVERMIRDAKATQIYEGTNQVQRIVVARRLLDELGVLEQKRVQLPSKHVSTARVRFSPAPTGSLHVGSARTALFNWLYARHNGGVFALRIEDTDRARSRDEWVHGIPAILQWLGLDWDEGPVLQSERVEDYLGAADDLLARGLAYECYCTPEELEARNAAARAASRAPGYDGHCRDLAPDARAALAAEGRPRSIRFRTPDDGVSRFEDAIRGEVAVEWSSIPDFVIVRSDGNPIFFLANAVDDLAMRITHVIRGEDLLDSTHRVLALRRALGATEQPVYAHLPLILAADRSKLSKRHGAIALEEFRDAGYLREAICNYLALLGWGPEDGREVMDLDEIVASFTLERVTQGAAAFDHKKLDWVNGEWIRRLPLATLEERARPFAEARFERFDRDVFGEAMRIGQERAVTLVSLVDQMDFLFLPDERFVLDPESWEKLTTTDRVADVLEAVMAHLEVCDWTPEGVDLRPALDALGVKPGKVMHVVYTAIEGRRAGLPLFESIVLLGRERSLTRIRAARARLGG